MATAPPPRAERRGLPEAAQVRGRDGDQVAGLHAVEVAGGVQLGGRVAHDQSAQRVANEREAGHALRLPVRIRAPVQRCRGLQHQRGQPLAADVDAVCVCLQGRGWAWDAGRGDRNVLSTSDAVVHARTCHVPWPWHPFGSPYVRFLELTSLHTTWASAGGRVCMCVLPPGMDRTPCVPQKPSPPPPPPGPSASSRCTDSIFTSLDVPHSPCCSTTRCTAPGEPAMALDHAWEYSGPHKHFSSLPLSNCTEHTLRSTTVLSHPDLLPRSCTALSSWVPCWGLIALTHCVTGQHGRRRLGGVAGRAGSARRPPRPAAA